MPEQNRKCMLQCLNANISNNMFIEASLNIDSNIDSFDCNIIAIIRRPWNWILSLSLYIYIYMCVRTDFQTLNEI